MEELKTRFPDGVDYDIAYDTTPFIRESIREFSRPCATRCSWLVWCTRVLARLEGHDPADDRRAGVVDRHVRVMAAMGFSLNNLTLFGLVLAIGIVVDDAIVVLENTERMIKKGYDARTATIKAMEEITGPILAITLALCSVFVPCCFIGGSRSVLSAVRGDDRRVDDHLAINALTMTPSRAVLIFKTEEGPMVTSSNGRRCRGGSSAWWGNARRLVRASPSGRTVWRARGSGRARRERSRRSDVLGRHGRLFRPRRGARRSGGWIIIRPVNAVLGWLFRGFNRLFDGVTEVYGWTVGKLLRLSMVVLLAYGCLVGLTYWVLGRAPTGFIPQQDQAV